MKRQRLTIILVLILLLLIPASTALAAPIFDTSVEKGETVNNDVVVFDGDLEIAEGAVINGDVIVFNGDALVAGTINGDLVLFNGDLDAGVTAVIGGDCLLLNGDLTDQTSGGLNCTDVESAPNFIAGLSRLQNQFGEGDGFDVTIPETRPNVGRGIVEALGNAALMAILAFVVASAVPTQLQQVETTVRQKPGVSGVVGLLTTVAVGSLATLLLPVSIILTLVCVGLLGFPIIFALLAGLGLAALLGWVTMGTWVGRFVAEKMNLTEQRLPMIAALGTAIMTLVFGLLQAIPFLIGGGVLAFAATIIGLGGATLTKLGTRPYPLVAGSAANVIVDAGTPDNAAKVTAVLETLPIEDPADLKEN